MKDKAAKRAANRLRDKRRRKRKHARQIESRLKNEYCEYLTKMNELLKETEFELKDKDKQRAAAEQKITDIQEENAGNKVKSLEALRTIFGG